MVAPARITFTVCAPDNLYHTVQYMNDRWYGMDNLASSIHDKDARWFVIKQLMSKMLVEIEGKWAGFEWVPLD